MTHQFIPGQIYHRRADIHAVYKGQQQGGICTPAQAPLVMIFMGEAGEAFGYHDGFREDGVLWYTGEGQRGEMQMVRGNLAIREHSNQGKHLLVFEQSGKGTVRFLGEAAYIGHHTEMRPDGDGRPRQAVVFELEMLVEPQPTNETSAPGPERRRDLWKSPLADVLQRAVAPTTAREPRMRHTQVRDRSQAVRIYVLRRADGMCEGCERPAPFLDPHGRPYLEPHHLHRLADGGPDHPHWVIALCPTCHRRVHYAGDGKQYNRELSDRMPRVIGADTAAGIREPR